MKYILLSLLVLLTSVSVAFAEFLPFGDTCENTYFDTIAYTVGEYPDTGKCPNCVEYDTSRLKGSGTLDIVGNTSIWDLVTEGDKCSTVRSALYTDLVLPPLSRVDFVYISANTGLSSVYISDIKMFISRSLLKYGDLRNVLNIEGEYEEVSVKYIIWNYSRFGIIKSYDGLGIVNGGVLNKGFVLDSSYVYSPVVFLDWELKDSLMKVRVKNVAGYVVNNIKYAHYDYEEVRDYEPYEEYVYEYNIDIEGKFELASIYNPNERRECAGLGVHMETETVDDSLIVGAKQVSGNSYGYAIGSRVKPYGDVYCITRLPYTLYSGEFSSGVSDELITDVVGQDSFEEVLGVTKLPQTSKDGLHLLFLLVVIPILWYYLIRRF